MGRPEQPVPYMDRALGRLALGLRAARQAADLTYHQLADKTPGFSRPTLQRAASGKTLPTKETVTAYAKACGIDPGPLLALWEIARAKERVVRLGSPAPSVRQIRDEADMGAALRRLHVEAGAPPYREIEKRTRDAAGVVRVPRNTVHQVLSRQRFPSSREQLRALLTALGVPAADHEDWLRAWSRVDRRLRSDRRAARSKKERKDRLQRRIIGAGQTPPCDDTHPRLAHHRDRCTTPTARPSEGIAPSSPAWLASLSGTHSQIAPFSFGGPVGTTISPACQQPRMWPPPLSQPPTAGLTDRPNPKTGNPSVRVLLAGLATDTCSRHYRDDHTGTTQDIDNAQEKAIHQQIPSRSGFGPPRWGRPWMTLT
ncbi:helix-turn-helix domain-containing protein [Streptomyces sp. NPDC127106]|uniref:helix-turn-helix domain-containing protein n=1 Tax=Streptomyces sp. NPDC127106 TaxID=3345360 RepID=UPI0036310003